MKPTFIILALSALLCADIVALDKEMRSFLDSEHINYGNADGTMAEKQKRHYMKKFEGELISQAEVGLWNRGASNGTPRQGLPRPPTVSISG
jgi:hypothetical protein